MPRRSWASFHTLQSVPLARSVHPSRGHVLPCGSPAAVRAAMPVSLSPAVSPTPALARACLVPRPTMGSLSRRVASHPTFPVTLGHEHRDQLGPRPSSTSKPCSSRESVRASRRFPGDPRPILSWAFRPSEAFSARASGPLTRRTASRPTPPRPEGFGARPRGLQRPEGRLLPAAPGETYSSKASPLASASSTDSGPLQSRPAPPHGGVPTPLTFGSRSKPRLAWPSKL